MSFDEVVGQEHVTKTLQAAIKSGRISHAYLFTGPRGVGKTSVARILAHEVNQIPYTGESVHLDIIEIDAASNRRIDEVRDLRERVRIAPASAKFKVYIIDEVHMLTREAFNALLKTLEEPPAHCIFILATTEAHKLPETIISRTQRFEFKPIGPADVAGHLGNIAKKEKITIDKDALELLADFGQGSFRDSISNLDQLSTHTGKITAEEVRQILGIPSQKEIANLLIRIRQGDVSGALESLQLIRGQGVDPAQTAAALAAAIRQLVVAGEADSVLISLLKQLLDVPGNSKPYDLMEIIILEASQAYAELQSGSQTIPPGDSPSDFAPGGSKRRDVKNLAAPKKPASNSNSRADKDKWAEVIERSKTQAASIYTALRLAKPIFEDDGLTLQFEFPLHQKKLDQPKNKQLVSKIVEQVYGSPFHIHSVLDKSAFKQAGEVDLAPADEEPAQLTSINNIFGGAEVLES